jgi:4-diphosphocytidyl-2-C-methyl-D-erythritol kinase
MKCTVKAPAKINLSLDVTGKREDGYHLLETVMQTVDLYDIITVSVVENETEHNKIVLTSNTGSIPLDIRNTAFKACSRYFVELRSQTNEYGFDININIEKNIPEQAGLAGGSADAAGVLSALNHLFKDAIDNSKLMKIAVAIGADVPFCLTGGTCLCKGIGEVITPLAGLPALPVIIVKPPFGVSTPWIFSNLKIEEILNKPDTAGIIEDIGTGRIVDMFVKSANVLEEVTIREFPIIDEIKKMLLGYGAIGSLMSGSGSSVFAVFEDKIVSANAYEAIKNNKKCSGYDIIATGTIQNGPIVVSENGG